MEGGRGWGSGRRVSRIEGGRGKGEGEEDGEGRGWASYLYQKITGQQ